MRWKKSLFQVISSEPSVTVRLFNSIYGRLSFDLKTSSFLWGEGNGTHSSTLAWKITWTEEPGRLQSMRSLRVGPDWATSLSLFTFTQWRKKWQPTPVFLPGESQGREAWRTALYGVAQSRTRLKRVSSSSSSSFLWCQSVCYQGVPMWKSEANSLSFKGRTGYLDKFSNPANCCTC